MIRGGLLALLKAEFAAVGIQLLNKIIADSSWKRTR